MNLFKIIFLFWAVISSTYSAGWDHNALVQMSWRTHWLDVLGKMEGPPSANICDHVSQCIYTVVGRQNILTQNQRTRVLERIAQGKGRVPGLDLIADLNQRGHPNVGGQIATSLNHVNQNYLDNELIDRWQHIDMRTVLESGTIPMYERYHHQSRDRRWTAGWILETMDIVRQQPFTTHLFNISPHNPANNDLRKIRDLSGTFGMLDGDGDFIEQFSGMIQPNQEILAGTDATVNIISCFHGVLNQQLNQLYFLPKGEDPILENLFQVQAVQVGGQGDFLSQARIDALFQEWNNSEWGPLFQQNDYAIIQVCNIAVAEVPEGERANSIKSILRSTDLLHKNQVIALYEKDENVTDVFAPNRIFAFGKPRYDFLQQVSAGGNGFCLVSDVCEGDAVSEVNPYLVHPLRRLINPTQLYQYNAATHVNVHEDTQLISKRAVSMPMTPGMSGGPVLRCQIETQRIRCELLGVAHGINLIRDEEDNELVTYKGLIAIPINHQVHH